MKTTYFYNKYTGAVLRATTKRALRKLNHLCEVMPETITPVSPKEGLTLNGGHYFKVKDII